MATIRLGLGQMPVVGGEAETNLAVAVRTIQDAATAGCDLVVLPECLDLGWTHPSAREQAVPIPGPRCDRLAGAARDAGIHLVAGLTERDGERVYNTAVLLDPRGRLLLKHRKINILEIAQDLYSIGDRLGVAHCELGCLGVNICADNFPNSLAQAHVLARMGAQLICSPSAWAVPADHDNELDPYGGLWRDAYAEIARLYGVAVVGVSNVGEITGGPWQGRYCIGCSLAVGADGEELLQASYGVAAGELRTVELELRQPAARGTSIAGMLRQRGYRGP